MNSKAASILVVTFLLNFKEIAPQSSSNIGDFVGQLTSLINQGGALGSALGAYAGASQGGAYEPDGPGGHPGAGGYGGQHPGALQGGGEGGGYGFPPGGGIPPGGIPPQGVPPPPGGGYGGYPQSSLYGALASIAQYDDLRCVPRLLCEVASGARPGSSHTSTSSSAAGPIPFLSRDAIITLLTVLNFVDDSPLLVFGRAAILGYTARGDPRQCLIAYPTCPRDPDKLVDYLNNHNGGFFRFFNQQIPQYAPQYQYYQQPPYPHPQYPGPGGPPGYPPQPPQYPHPQQYYQRPQRPLPPHAYPQRPGQRPYRKQPPYSQYYQQQQGRIQNAPQANEYDYLTSEGGTSKLVFSSNLDSAQYYQGNNNYNQQQQQQQEQLQQQQQQQQQSSNALNNNYDAYAEYYSNYNGNSLNSGGNNNYYNNKNDNANNYYASNNQNSNSNSRFAFPTEPPSSPAPSVIPLPSTASSIPSIYPQQQDSTGSFSHRDVRRGKTLAFPNGQTSPSKYQQIKSPGTSSTMVFPDRTGTGDLRLDLDEYGGYKTVHFASESSNNRPTNGGIFRDQRDTISFLRFPKDRSIHNDATISIRAQQIVEDNGRAAAAEKEPTPTNTIHHPDGTNT